jgi:hypothetical protein
MAAYEIPITRLYECYNTMKEETVQNNCRNAEEIGWER